MRKYEWAVIGGGIAGIAVREILSREGHSVVLIEKNSKLASETTREFHEWIHTGALYTLVPDTLMTLKFILGSIDDLKENVSPIPDKFSDKLKTELQYRFLPALKCFLLVIFHSGIFQGLVAFVYVSRNNNGEPLLF